MARVLFGVLVMIFSVVGIGSVAAQELSSMHAQRAERGDKICMTDHFHTGTASAQPSKAKARSVAIANWISFTDLEYGSAWANFRIAGSRSLGCKNDVDGWYCEVEARPCRSSRTVRNAKGKN